MKQKPVATALLIFLAFLIYQPLTRDILFFNNSLLTSLIFEAIWALVVLVFIYMISGSGTLKFTKKGFGYAFKIA